MKPAPFVYHAPTSVGEAVSLLRELACHDPRILAGGQSLIPAMALRLARPGHLIDINGVAGLDSVMSNDNHLRIGATIRHARMQHPSGLGELGKLLAHVVRHIAHYPIRQRGTFCGSLAHADPASEWCLVTQVFDGALTAEGTNGRREIAASDYFCGIMTTALEPTELLTEVRLSQILPSTRWAFEEFSMRAGDFAVAMALVAYDVISGRISNARIGIGGVEAYPRRIPEVERVLNGARPTQAIFVAAGEAVGPTIDPLNDWQADGAERQRLASALVKRALSKTLGGPF